MPRELKFRVWNGLEMIYDVMVGKFGVFYINPGIKGTGLDPNDSASITPFNTKYTDTTPVMQYTGLKDKDGKEIFQEDIIESISSYGAPIRHVIKFREEDAQFVGVHDANTGFISYSTISQKWINEFKKQVIGNTYQNPDLNP